MNRWISKQRVTVDIADRSNKRVHSPCDGNTASTSIKKISLRI